MPGRRAGGVLGANSTLGCEHRSPLHAKRQMVYEQHIWKWFLKYLFPLFATHVGVFEYHLKRHLFYQPPTFLLWSYFPSSHLSFPPLVITVPKRPRYVSLVASPFRYHVGHFPLNSLVADFFNFWGHGGVLLSFLFLKVGFIANKMVRE